MIVVKYILPALRVAITRELVQKYGLKKTDVAEKMDVTPAAITQYVKGSRGDVASSVIKRSSKVMELVSDITFDIALGESPPDLQLLKMCRACRQIRAEGLICDLHKESMPSLNWVETCTCSLGLVELNKEQLE